MRNIKITSKITPRDSKGVEKYLRDISRIPQLSLEEEVALAKKIRSSNGADLEAVQELIRANLRFVVSVAKQYQNGTVMLCDLINEGNVGLIKAATRFDETKGFRFISYAVWWIRQSIAQFVGENSRAVRLPSNRTGIIQKMLRTSGEFVLEHEREPTTEELAKAIEKSPAEVAELEIHLFPTIRFDNPIDEQGHELYEIIPSTDPSPDYEVGHNESLKIQVQQVLSCLEVKQKTVITGLFGLDGKEVVSLDDMAKLLNVSKERVRQIKERALVRLKYNKHARMIFGM